MTFDLEYQTRKHLDAHMQQWPKNNRADAEKEIRERLKSGNAWLWHEPWNMKQLEIFDHDDTQTNRA